MPTLILVDTDGTILWRHQGYMPGEEAEIELREKMDGLNKIITTTNLLGPTME